MCDDHHQAAEEQAHGGGGEAGTLGPECHARLRAGPPRGLAVTSGAGTPCWLPNF